VLDIIAAPRDPTEPMPNHVAANNLGIRPSPGELSVTSSTTRTLSRLPRLSHVAGAWVQTLVGKTRGDSLPAHGVVTRLGQPGELPNKFRAGEASG